MSDSTTDTVEPDTHDTFNHYQQDDPPEATSDSYYETAGTTGSDTWNNYQQDEPPESADDWNDDGPETSYYDDDYGYEETLDETKARITSQDDQPRPQEQDEAAPGNTSQPELATADDTPGPAVDDDIPASQKNPQAASDQSSPVDTPDGSGTSQEPAGSQDETYESGDTYESPAGTADPKGYQETGRELSNREHPGPARDESSVPNGASSAPRSIDNRDPSRPDAATDGQEEAPGDDAASAPAQRAGNTSQGADISSTGTGADRGGQNTESGQADSAGPPRDPPDPPGGDNHAEMSPDARIAGLQAQLAQSNAELAQTKGELSQTKNQLDQANTRLNHSEGELDETRGQLAQTKGELDETKNEHDQTKGQLDKTKNELDRANQKIADLNANPHNESSSRDAYKPTETGQISADTSRPEQRVEDTDKSRAQDAAGKETKLSGPEFDKKVPERNKTRVRRLVSPDNIAIGAAMWDAQDAVQKIATHAVHDAASPSVAVALGVAGVVLSKIQEHRREKKK